MSARRKIEAFSALSHEARAQIIADIAGQNLAPAEKRSAVFRGTLHQIRAAVQQALEVDDV